MIKESIYHRPKSSYAYAYDAATLHIRLRCKKGDLTAVKLIYGDPYHWENGPVTVTAPMFISGSDESFDYWFISIQPSNLRFAYLFEVSDGQETLVYAEKGFTLREQDNRSFRFPYLNAIDVFKTPGWVKNTIWYQIYPDRFANGNPDGKKELKLAEWGAEPEPGRTFGGDLQGIIDHLDHLVDLGVNGIYMTPIFKSPSDHKYDTTDYLEIDPQFGDKETFRKLVNACHERGIRIILDAVFNHCGYFFEQFQDVLKNGAKSRYKDWFHIHQFPENGEPTYETFAYVKEMPKLNTSNPELKEYLLGVSRYWLEEFGTDGWRLDVANEIDHEFWRDFRKVVRGVNKDAYIVAEVWHDANAWLQGDQFDAVMNYPFTEAVVDFIAKGKINAEQYANLLIKEVHNYSELVSEVTFNLLGSHDTARILTECKDNKEKLKLAFLLLLTYIGSPCIYYGDEVGLTGDGPDFSYYRRCMQWDKSKQDQNLLSHVKKLIQLRKTIKPLTASAHLSVIEANGETNHIVFERAFENESVIVLLNNGDAPVSITLPEAFHGKTGVDLWTNETVSLTSSSALELQPNQFSLIHIAG